MTQWDGDLLGYSDIGDAFTNLVKSIDGATVISIEAGFGRGKTFFRRAWSNQLRQSGEVVVEVDLQQSDHSGDPVVTLLGAMVESLPNDDKNKAKQAFDSAKKLAFLGAKTVTKTVLRAGADELIDELTNSAIDKLGNFDELDDFLKNFGDGMSKVAGEFISTQMAAERVRKKELPEQLKLLQSALCENSKADKVVVIIDELDRCHPDYAIAVLEALKIIFGQENFVFCLMINAEYLERLAQHRFGASDEDEKYLDKFVDIRLALKPKEEDIKTAVFELAKELPLAIPFGEDKEFSVERAAELAGELAVYSKFSIRKVKRILLKVEMALRCYADRPLDLALLVFLAYQRELRKPLSSDFLARSMLTPEEGEGHMAQLENDERASFDGNNTIAAQLMRKGIEMMGREIANLPIERYRVPDVSKNYYDWAKVYKFLAPHYIPTHQEALDVVAKLVVEVKSE